MNKLRSFSLLILVFALGAAACSGGSSVAATVNGVDITNADVEALTVDGEIGDTQFLEALTTLIQWEISAQAAAADFSVEPLDGDIETETKSLLVQFGVTSTEEFATSQGISEELLNRYIRQVVIQNGVASAVEAEVAAPSTEAIAAERAANPSTWTEVCVAHFLVETEEEATAAMARLEAGETFADVASDVSVDPGSAANGGDLGCASPARFVDPFAQATLDAPLDEAFGPVESEFGFHVVLVSSRSESTDGEISDYLLGEAVREASESWFDEAVRAADVTVADGLGQWSTDPEPRIVAVG